MDISGISGSTASQLYQVASQKIGGQTVQQPQQVQQGPSEESRESPAVQSQEANSGGEDRENGGSINVYV